MGYVARLQDDLPSSLLTSGEPATATGCTVPPTRIEKICEDLYAVADACDVEKLAVWGFSSCGNIARYIGAWSDRVRAIAVIGVPSSPAAHADFDRCIGYVAKWNPQVQAYRCPAMLLAGTENKSVMD